MATQKIPLFNGLIVPVADSIIDVFAPPDADLTEGTQATYELHLWYVFNKGSQAEGNDVVFAVAAQEDGGSQINVWIGPSSGQTDVNHIAVPIKVLDGYPVRGNVTIQAAQFGDGADIAPGSLYGYYYRVGQGLLFEGERRAIGASLDDFNAGVPLTLTGTKQPIHVFEKDRIDEISLAFATSDSAFVTLTLEDVNNNLIPGTAEIELSVGPGIRNFERDPQSVYTLFQAPLGGGGSPTLHHISAKFSGIGIDELRTHGYFVRH